jgi:hypothetical protein
LVQLSERVAVDLLRSEDVTNIVMCQALPEAMRDLEMDEAALDSGDPLHV